MSKLYELTADYAELESWLYDEEEVDEETLLDTLEGVEGEFNVKIENYCKLIKNFEADAKAFKEESKRLAARGKTIENKIDWLKKSMFDSMKATGKNEAGGDLIKAKIAKNGGKLPVIVDAKDEDIPVEYKKVTYSVDKEAIREALELGQKLDFAHMGERGEHLNIR